ncbi:MAG: hypothetical protein Ct9H300mP14_16860 [Gammaproteobacteria bacterium]|nr:MAG: hypothetical protein Ct9H300mP14_16860 [Gammaproteobacteria bacterium]
MNAERTLIAGESLGDARYFLRRASDYANEREIFGGPIGRNQGVQFPLARLTQRRKLRNSWPARQQRCLIMVSPAVLRPTWLNCLW